MWGCKKKDDQQVRIEQLEDELTRYQNALVRERELVTEKCSNASFEFDFNAVKVFSVERNTKDNLPVTVIGYVLEEPMFHPKHEMWLPVPKIREWYLYCSDERHEELVSKFRESLKNG